MPEVVAETVSVGGNARVFYRGGWGFVHFERWEDLKSRLQDALLLAQLSGARSEERRLALKPPIYLVRPLVVKEDPRNVPLWQKVDLLKEYVRVAMDVDPKVKMVQAQYFDRYRHMWFATSHGTYVEQEKLDLGGGIMVQARSGNGSQGRSVGFGSSDDFGAARGLESQIEDAAKIAVQFLEADEIEGGEYTVVLDPHLAGVFAHEAFGHLSEADGLAEDPGLREVMRLGRKFGPDFLHIYDTGRDEGTRGYLPVDDEGIEGQDVDLIKDGYLVGRLHSQETATELGESPTGNARALNYRHPPIVRMRNTVIAPGETSFADLFHGIKKGVYAKGSYGGQTNGELFTFLAAEAYLIEDGQVVKPLRNAVLTGNVFNTLGNISAVGNDFTRYESGGGCGKAGQMPLPVSHHSPSIRIEHVLMGGKR